MTPSLTSPSSGVPSGAAGGDLSGTFPNPSVATVGGKAAALALVPTAVKSAPYTAAAGDFVPVDASAGAVTVTLPTAPADKTRVGVKIVAQAATPNTVTLARGGTDVFNKTGGSTGLTLSALFQGLILQYAASTGVWYVQSLDAATGNAGGAASLGSDGKHKTSEIPASVLSGAAAGLNKVLVFSQSGSLAVATGSLRARLPFACTIVSAAATVGTAPTGASVIVDVKKNGTTIYTTQANRPTVAISANASGDAVPDVTAAAAGDYITVDVAQIGSTAPGQDLVVSVWYS